MLRWIPALLLLVFLNAVASENAASKRIYAPMKPHDHTGRALDIMTKRDVMRFDYGAQIYTKHCQRCHGMGRQGEKGPELSDQTLKRFETISDLFPYIKKGCSGKGTPSFDKLSDIAAIFVARYIKSPLKKHNPIDHPE